jgi:uncharacterized protein
VHYLWLVPLGFVIGACGTLIGAGGGFVLMPVLLLLFPNDNPELITSISLAVVFFNALSGSTAYAPMRRIDYRSGLLFAAATIPGAILGALTTDYVPRRLFDGVFGLVLVAASLFLLLNGHTEPKPAGGNPRDTVCRTLVERDGTAHRFSFNPRLGLAISFVVGYVSSLLGIGGGIVHVPALVHFLNFPVHVATATSHFILAIMALAGTLVHVAKGTFVHGTGRTAALAIGVILGAPLGARISKRVHGRWIMRGLAVALGLVGVRILALAF